MTQHTRPRPYRSATKRLLTCLIIAGSVTAAAGCTSGPAGGSPSASPGTPTTLRVHHPTSLAFAAPFTVMSQAKSSPASYETWKTPDVMRSLVTSNRTDLIATPSYVGANLHNKGIPVRLAAVTVWGIIHLVGPEGAATDWASLKGKTIVVPFKGDMPDLVLTYLLKKNGLDPASDVSITHVTDMSEASAAVVGGHADYAVLPEHLATVTVAKAKEAGRSVVPLLDLQQEWASATGQQNARIPQAGILVRGDIPEKHPQEFKAVLSGVGEAIRRLNEKDQSAIEAAAQGTGVPVPLVTSVVPRLKLQFVSAEEARPELERFYTELSTLNPDIIGGKLPGDGFYLKSVR